MVTKNILLDEIYKKTGIYISTKRDCRDVSNIINDSKIGYLSESTLYRFFLYDKPSNKPYKNTLNILAQFCGYMDWNSFVKYYHSNDLFHDPVFLNQALNTVIQQFVLQENYKALIAVFDSLEQENYKTKEYFGVKVILNFKKTLSFPNFIKSYGQHPFVRNIIMESLYDPNHTITGYDKGIEYYLTHTNKNLDSYIQDTIFGQTILFRYYYLHKNPKALLYGQLLYENTHSNLTLKSIHIFPKTRFVAYRLWYLTLINNTLENMNQAILEITTWLQNEFTRTTSIIELNILHNTIFEVLKNLNLKNIENEFSIMFANKTRALNLSVIDFEKIHNPNGLLNLIS